MSYIIGLSDFILWKFTNETLGTDYFLSLNFTWKFRNIQNTTTPNKNYFIVFHLYHVVVTEVTWLTTHPLNESTSKTSYRHSYHEGSIPSPIPLTHLMTYFSESGHGRWSIRKLSITVRVEMVVVVVVESSINYPRFRITKVSKAVPGESGNIFIPLVGVRGPRFTDHTFVGLFKMGGIHHVNMSYKV